MTFEEILDQAIAMLQRRGRVSYRALKLQFHLDEDALEALTEELLFSYPQVSDEDGRGLIWTGPSEVTIAPAAAHDQTPFAYTPPHLAEKILHSKAALEGERKQVTVLFADIKGSTEMIAGLDPEAARQILDPVLHTMMEAVHRYEGTVNQVLGDGIMALFGAPIAHEDHAVRACYAALAMQEMIHRHTEAIRRSHGLEVQIRVGMNSGAVVVRAIGNDLHMDYSAIGQTTHLAARMEQLAPPGSIRLTGETLRLVEGLMQVTSLGPIPVKGIPEPVDVFALTGASPIRRRLQAMATRGLTRFVGRQTELETLHQAGEKARADQGQVVAVIGEPGVGKSRLFYEFVHSHRTQGWLVLESSAVSYGKATPYLPVIALLKNYFQLEERDEERQRREKVMGKLLTLDTALQPTLPAFLSLFDVPVEDAQWEKLDPSQRRHRTLEACKRLFLRESHLQPVLVVCENLHWIDSETQHFLDSLIERLPTARLLLLVNYRPEYQHGWGSKTYYTQLRLDPLSSESAEAFLQTLLGNDASLTPLKHLLIERTERNPFFLEESVRTLMEAEVIVGERGAYRLVQPLPMIQVPATVQAVLAARIDRLPSEEKRLLQAAAVIGTEVPFPILQAIAEMSAEELRRGLTHLQAAEFLYETRLFPELEYTFKHALTHQVAYESLLQERRRSLHARIVEALESFYTHRLDDQMERLASHAFRGTVWEKALTYCWQAGVKAVERSAHREAVTSFEQALAALSHLPQTRERLEQAIDLRLEMDSAFSPLGEQERSLHYMREAYTYAESLNDQRRLGWVSAYMTFPVWYRGDTDSALTFAQRASAIAIARNDLVLQVMANLFLGQIFNDLGDYRRAMDVLSRNGELLTGELLYEHFRFVTSGVPSVQSRNWLVRCLAEVGEFAAGITCGQESVRIAETVDHPYSIVAACWGIGYLYLRKGDLRQAIDTLERGRELCQIWDLQIWVPGITAVLGVAYTLSWRISEALPLLERAVEQAVSLGMVANRSLLIAWLSEGYLLAGRLEEASQLAGRALDLSQACKNRGEQAWILRLLGDLAMHRDPRDIDQAETHYQDALTVATALDMRPLQAHCHRGLGLLYVQTGQREHARSTLATAIELYRSMEMTFWLPQTEEALAQVEGR